MKNSVSVKVKFAKTHGKLKTLEGDVSYKAGAAIIQGETEEVWPLERDKFDENYEAISGTTHGIDGYYQKRLIEALAIKLTEPACIQVGYANDVIMGQPGDWLLQYAENEFGIVNSEIFKKTYTIIN